MLENWDFSDEAANASGANRQKSATRLIVLAIDRVARSATFFDSKREQEHTATLKACDCRDFSFSGKSPRKSFAPCMHIYRLASELSLFSNKYDDPAERITPAQAAEVLRRHALAAKKAGEDDRLRTLPKATEHWGGWHSDVHTSGVQRNRQMRAYVILDDEPGALSAHGHTVRVHGYEVTPARCDCPDFTERRLPCKHMYVLAISDGVDLPVSASEYHKARLEGKELLFRFEDA
jgi:hypothetical protein